MNTSATYNHPNTLTQRNCIRTILCPILLLAAPLFLGACGGGSSDTAPLASYTIGGTVNGLNGNGLMLRVNGNNDLAITTDGVFTFTNVISSGSSYSVSVATQPTNQNCTIDNGGGTVSGNIANIEVNCFALQSVVYTRLAGGTQQDLFLVKEDGSGLVTLADTIDPEYFEAVTPTGKILYLNAADDLQIANADGTGSVFLASNASIREDLASVTTSGRVILSRFNSLYSVNTDGTGLVGFGAAGTENFAGISPGGKIIFSRFDNAVPDKHTILSSNADGTGEVQISPTNTSEYEVIVAITPSGRVIFQRSAGIGDAYQRDLFSINEDGSGLVTLSNDALSDEFIALIANERVIYRRPPSPLLPWGELYSVKADGTGAATLTSSSDNEYYSGATADGKVIYFRDVYDPVAQITQSDLYIINADGTGLIALGATPDSEYFADVTPAGKILFTRSSAGQTDLYLINADGSGEQRLTNTAEDEYFNCSVACVAANGRLIFSRVSGNQSDLFSIRPDGTAEQILANTTDNEYISGITASSRVIFERTVGNQNNLYSINADGTDLRTLADTADSETLSAIY